MWCWATSHLNSQFYAFNHCIVLYEDRSSADTRKTELPQSIWIPHQPRQWKPTKVHGDRWSLGLTKGSRSSSDNISSPSLVWISRQHWLTQEGVKPCQLPCWSTSHSLESAVLTPGPPHVLLWKHPPLRSSLLPGLSIQHLCHSCFWLGITFLFVAAAGMTVWWQLQGWPFGGSCR